MVLARESRGPVTTLSKLKHAAFFLEFKDNGSCPWQTLADLSELLATGFFCFVLGFFFFLASCHVSLVTYFPCCELSHIEGP
jgi:hypothetical protein